MTCVERTVDMDFILWYLVDLKSDQNFWCICFVMDLANWTGMYIRKEARYIQTYSQWGVQRRDGKQCLPPSPLFK